MPDTELDEATREFATFLRTSLQAASQLAEQRARNREQKMRTAEAQSQSSAREYAQRITAERAAAETQLRRVWTDGWWDKTDREAVIDNYLLAKSWSGSSPQADEAVRLIEREAKDRYGIDPATLSRTPGADKATVEAAIAVADRIDRAVQNNGISDPSERSEADSSPTAEPIDTSPDYDSAARRAAVAATLESAGVDADLIDVRMSADLDQAMPAADAVLKPGTTPRARKGRPAGSRDAERTRSGR